MQLNKNVMLGGVEMNVNKKIINILKELSGYENIEENSRLEDDLGLDSIGMVMLLIELEDNFEIQLDESDMNPFELQLVEDVTELVYKYLEDEND